MERAIVDLDVREILRAKGEPFQAIMQAAHDIGPHDVFQLHATFKPEPLFRVLGKLGFSNVVAQFEEDHFAVQFCRDKEDVPLFFADLRGIDAQEASDRAAVLLDQVPDVKTGTAALELWLNTIPDDLTGNMSEKGYTVRVGDEAGYTRLTILKK